jgi:hypothetical protein
MGMMMLAGNSGGRLHEAARCDKLERVRNISKEKYGKK